MLILRSLLLVFVLGPAVFLECQAQNAVTRSLFDPDLYTPLNGGFSLTLNSGDTLAIDTSALTITRNGVSLGTGVVGNTAGAGRLHPGHQLRPVVSPTTISSLYGQSPDAYGSPRH